MQEFNREDYYAAYETFNGALFRKAQESLVGTQKLLTNVLKLFLSKGLLHETSLILDNFVNVIKRLRLPFETWYIVFLSAAESIGEMPIASSLALKCIQQGISGLKDKKLGEPREKAINLLQKLASTTKENEIAADFLSLAAKYQLELNNIAKAEENLKKLFNTFSPQRDGLKGLKVASYLALFRLLVKDIDSAFEVLRTYRKQLPAEERKMAGKVPHFELAIECIQAFRSNSSLNVKLAEIRRKYAYLKDELLSELLRKLGENLPPPTDISSFLGLPF
jgi:tetratricopeptide (TPR) repeat protein